MVTKRLYILGGDYSDETRKFEFLIASEADPPGPGSEVIIDRTVIVRLLEKGYCVQVARPVDKAVSLVQVGGESYLRTDEREIAADYIEGVSVALIP